MKIKEAYENLVKVKRCQWKESTYYKYQRIYNTYIDQYFKDIEVESMDVSLIERYFQSLEVSNNTKLLIRNLLNQIIKPYDMHIRYSIRKQNKEIEVLTTFEQRKLEAYIYSKDMTYFDLGILICLYTGLRLGEICALKWKDIHLEEGAIIIKHSIIRLPNQDNQHKTILKITEPKSLSSYRKVPIVSKLMNEIREIDKESDGYVLSNTKDPIDPRRYEYYFQRLLRKSGIRKIKFHSLRHTFATRCIERKIDVKTVSEILGHSDISITIKYYIKSSFEFKKEQIEKLIDHK